MVIGPADHQQRIFMFLFRGGRAKITADVKISRQDCRIDAMKRFNDFSAKSRGDFWVEGGLAEYFGCLDGVGWRPEMAHDSVRNDKAIAAAYQG